MSPSQPKRNARTRRYAPRSFVPIPEDEAPTAFARLVIRRMNRLKLNKNRFCQRVCEITGREWHRGMSGPFHFILTGQRPPTVLGEPDDWIKATDLEPWGPEANELRKAFAEQVAYTRTGGEGASGDTLAKRLHKIEAENAALRERNQALESEVIALRAELGKRHSR